jgi:hypothetical protein
MELRRRVYERAAGVLLAGVLMVPAAWPASAQEARRAPGAPQPTIEERTSSMKKLDGFFPVYWDERAGQLWMEISRFNTEVLHAAGMASGLGSNDIGIDRGQTAGSRIVHFERVGPKVLMVQPNYKFRAPSDNPAEVRATRDAFARSVLFSFPIAAESNGRVLVDLTEFLLRDAGNLAGRLRPGSYRFDAGRSSIYMPGTFNFPKNTELEAELTYVLQPGGGAGGGGFGGGPGRMGGEYFEGVGSVAATSEAASVRMHHAFVELPDGNYTPRRFDPRSSFAMFSWEDRAAPLGSPMTQRFIRRHRLNKVDPAAKVSDPVKPIVYYLDAGVPEPIRSALLEGARWWNQAFEAAGYRNAFRVELLPEGAHPLDIRYNVINWVHRSTRGWSYGASVADPRTGEIIKGVVSLGSLRIRQDYLIAEGLLSPYQTGTETPKVLSDWALARICQLSAHEVGHTLGIMHNYYDSEAGRISVMDYPHPLVTLRPDGTLDTSKVYDVGIGAWDKVSIAYGYQDFPKGTDEARALASLLDEAWTKDLRYLTNQDIEAHPRVDQWSNGTDAAAELTRMMAVRRWALDRFGERAIQLGQPLATLEEALVPLYLHHRYQVEATATVLGGQHYIYAIRGDGREPFRRASATEQNAALTALVATLRPSELALPRAIVSMLPPRPEGYDAHRELFPRYTGPVFDVITPAVVASDHTISNILQAERAARLVEQRAVDPSLPGLRDVLAALRTAAFGAAAADPYEEEVGRAVQRVLVERTMSLAAGAAMPQVRAEATAALIEIARQLDEALSGPAPAATAAHATLLARDIRRFLDRPAAPVTPMTMPSAPPGAPIGEPAMRWLDRLEPPCSHWGPGE